MFYNCFCARPATKKIKTKSSAMTNRRDLAWALASSLLTISLLAVMTTASVSAYSFWSASSILGKVIKPPPPPPAQLPATQQSSNERRHISSTTTSSSTTQMPAPLELHFEFNPDGLAYERTPDSTLANNVSEQLPAVLANGSLILEDLVNQFARNFQASELNKSRASNKSGDNSAEPTTQKSMQLLNTNDDDGNDDDDDDNVEQGQHAHSSEHDRLDATSFAQSSSSHDSLVDPPADEPDPDRHIQYDMTNLLTNNLVDSITTHQALHVQDNSQRLSSTTGGPLMGTPSDNKQNSNLTSQTKRPQPPTLTVSQTLTNVTIPTPATSLENDTSILGPAMSSNSSRALAAANLIQARSMSPGSSGHLSSLSNHRPPPVVGQKPPYASSYQLHHRGAIDLSIPAGRDGQNTSSHNTNQVAPQANKRQDQMTSGGGGGELTNKVDSISSSLLMSDSLGTVAGTSTTTSTTTGKPPPQPPGLAQTLQSYLAAAAGNSAGFSERQDERSDELERVANKLAPSELTELTPIESASMLNSAHQLHYQPDQVSPADTGSGPADSNNVVVSHYHSDHYAPQLANSGLSEPANSISSYLQAKQQQQQHYQASSIDETNNELNQRAHDTKGGAPAAGLVTSGGNDERIDRVNSPQVQVHRRTIETLSNQIAHADGNLISANTLAIHQHKERSPLAHNGRDAPNSGHQQQVGGSYAASLINVTAPIVLPLSATEAMEATLGGDSAARQMMHHVGGGTTLAQAANQDQRYPAPVQTTPPQRSSYYVIPPPPQPSDGLHHLSIYSRPASQFRPGASATSFTHPAADTHSPYEHLVVESQSQTQTTMSAAERERMRLGDSGSQHASGFRSPFGQYPASVTAAAAHMLSPPASVGVPTPSSYLSGMSAPSSSTSSSSSSSYSSSTLSPQSSNKFVSSTPPSMVASVSSPNRFAPGKQQQQTMTTTVANSSLAATTNGFITGSVSNSSSSSSSGSTSLAGIVSTNSDIVVPSSAAGTGSQQQSSAGQVTSSSSQQATSAGTGLGKRVFNLTRVEHISAECSNDLIRTIIIFNGTFKGIIYSSGYVRDSNCLYVNGTGKTRYDFSIKLNQCGTLGRQEIHPAGGGPGGDGLRRRDQVMWNTLSIQYNPIIEQEWDEHFRVSCEYGSDFWKTISFSPFNVETNTGSPVVFTVDPPQCQMEILKGHGMVGPRQETITGPVTVGDPLTLLIHMKSEKAGYDILVKNCVAHNGGQQKMQLIDTNGCVVNERFISPFRGTYNDNDLKHVTLYSYLKAFRFTGSPVLYLECEVHMCQTACPPQMCYWRRLSKRSTSGQQRVSSDNTTGLEPYDRSLEEFDVNHYGHSMGSQQDDMDDDATLEQSRYVKTIRFNATTSTTESPPEETVVTPNGRPSKRLARELRLGESGSGGSDRRSGASKKQLAAGNKQQENLSDSISLFQALEVRQEREDPNSGDGGGPSASQRLSSSGNDLYEITGIGSGDASQSLMCYQRIEIFAFLFTVASILLAAVSVTIGCYYRASSIRRVSLAAGSSAHQQHQRALVRKQRLLLGQPAYRGPCGSLSLSSANLCYSPFSSSSSSAASSCSPTSSEGSGLVPPHGHSVAGSQAGGCPPNYLLLDQNLHFGPPAAAAAAATNNRQVSSDNINLDEIGAHFRFQQLARAATKRQPGP